MLDITLLSDSPSADTLTDAQLRELGKLAFTGAIRTTPHHDLDENQDVAEDDKDLLVYVSTSFSVFVGLPLAEDGWAPLAIRPDGRYTDIEGNLL